MNSNIKLALALAVSFSLLSGCSSTHKKSEPVAAKENIFNTEDNTMAVPGGDSDKITTNYSSADLGTASSGMGR